MSLTAQKARYPRSRSSLQSANSSQKAKRPSSGKQKMSSFSSYTKSEQPFLLRYVSTLYRSSRRGSIGALRWLAGLLSLRSMTARVETGLPFLESWHLCYAFWRDQKYSKCVESTHPQPNNPTHTKGARD